MESKISTVSTPGFDFTSLRVVRKAEYCGLLLPRAREHAGERITMSEGREVLWLSREHLDGNGHLEGVGSFSDPGLQLTPSERS